MKRLSATLVTDGSSDQLLKSLIELLFDEHTDWAYQVQCAQGLPPASEGLRARMAAALALYPCDFLFVHRDAEALAALDRQQEIKASWPDAPQTTTLICVVPVRMTEAWLLASEAPIRAAVGNPNGTASLGLPAAKNIEALPDPKAVLFDALRVATEWNTSRKRKFNPHDYRHRVSELTDDLAPLRQLSSFRHLETQIKSQLQGMKTP